MLIGLAIGALLVVVAAGIISQFDTPEARDEIGNIVNAVPPIMQGLAGKPVNVETLGGYIQYKYGGFLPLVTGLWSILALSATLAGESKRQLGHPGGRAAEPRRIAWQKVLGHVLMVAVAMAIVGTVIAVAGSTMAAAGRRDHGTVGLRVRLLALADVAGGGIAGLRAGSIRRSWIGGRARRRSDAGRVPAGRLSGRPSRKWHRSPT